MVREMELILGHNQFIGINHISDDKSREREKKFSKIENIYKTVEIASGLGYKNMIMETHPRMLEFFNFYLENQTFDMDFYLQVPYAVGYVKKMNEEGITGLLSDIVNQTGFLGAGGMALKGAASLLRKNYMKMAMSVLKLEVSPFTEVNIKALLLHNVFTDLLLSLDISEAFIEFENYVKDNLNMKPGFNTLNFSLLARKCEEWDLSYPISMTPINPKGFDMNPSQTVVENSIKGYKGRIIAMNVLGGGAFSLKDSYEYIKSLGCIDHCVIGASSTEHLKELRKIFQ